ncbi:MAG TPA: condensation domain-containing protein, partial [Rhizomicrobium sp.]
PTHLKLLLHVLAEGVPPRLRTLIVGGEDLKTGLARAIHTSLGGRVDIYNEYGPTEATVGCMIHKYSPDQDTALSVPIGTAIDHSSVFVLDRHGNPVPLGVSGELHIAGEGLAAGYLNNPALTDERFVVKRLGGVPLRLYRTGDLARILPDGKLEYLGRNDDQVKIRGFRVELGEVEAHVARVPGVAAAAVTHRVDAAGDSHLCAYVELSGAVSPAEVRARLAEQLPAHMVPTWITPLAQLPVGSGGKIDKARLPNPQASGADTHSYAAPRSPHEAAMATIWEHILGVEKIGLDDNFFESGGQSLKATIMTVLMNRQLGVSFALQDVFAHPTIRQLAALMQPDRPESRAIAPVGERPYHAASSSQKRLFILNRMAPLAVQYNVPWAVRISGVFDAARWQEAFAALIARHEPLRTSFSLIDDDVVQRVHNEVDFAFEAITFAECLDLNREIARFAKPFDLGKAPLLRAEIIKTGDGVHTLIVDTHHIVTDGLSFRVILDELVSLYRGQALEPLEIQYKDYAAWQRARSQSDDVKAQRAYWTKLFEGELPVLNLPTDFPRSAVQSFAGGLLRFETGREVAEGLHAIARRCGVTMHMVLLAAYAILLSKHTGQDDLVVGTPVSGRNHPSLQKLVGMFVHTLALRMRPEKGLSFEAFLERVRDSLLEAYDNQDCQFDELVEHLAVERDLSRNPLFDTVFATLDTPARRMEFDGTAIELLDFDWNISKFDLTLLASERDGTLAFELEYCAGLFRRDTIERMAAHYGRLLEQIAADPARSIAAYGTLTEAERRQTLVAFNRTEHAYPTQQSIHAIIEDQVERTPANLALVHGGTALTYCEMNRRANQLARLLLRNGAA